MPGQTIKRQIAGGETNAFNITLGANQFLSLSVNQLGIDVVVDLLAPDGKMLREVDSPSGASGAEKLMFIAPVAGVYVLQVHCLEKAAKPGNYEAQIIELRASTTADEQRIAAAQLVEEAFALQEQRKTEGFLKAIEKYKQALELLTAAGDRAQEGVVRGRLGTVYVFVNQFQTALDENMRALALIRESKDASAEVGILENIGRSYYELEKYPESFDFYNQALQLREKTGVKTAMTVALNGISSVYAKTNEYRKAIEFNNRVLALYVETGNIYGQAGTLNNLGTLYVLLGEHYKAIEIYNQALVLFRQVKIQQFEAVILTNIGRSYGALGEQQTAIEYYNQALPLARAVGNRLIEATTLNNIGTLYHELGDRNTALDYHNQALPILRELGKREFVAATLNNIGEIYKDTGDLPKALDYFHQALATAREVGDRASESTVLNNIGSILNMQEKNADALATFSQALEIRRALGNRAAEAITLTSIANAQIKSNEVNKALKNYEQALVLARAVKDNRVEAETLYYYAKLLNDQNRLEESRTNIEAALAIVELRRNSVISQDLRSSYLASMQNYYNLRTDIFMRLNKARPDGNFDALALQSAEKARARSLMDLLNESRADIKQGVDPALLEQEKALRLTLAAKSNYQTRILGGKHTAEQEAAVNQEIKKLSDEYEKIETEIRIRSPRYAALTQPTAIPVKEIQSQLLDPDTVLLEYALGEETSYLWVVSQNSLKSYELPKRAEIENAARRIYEILTARNLHPTGETDEQRASRIDRAEKDFSAASAALSKMILAPAAAELKNRRLLIVADGALQYVPFAALESQSAKIGARFLIETNEIVALPSASTLALLRSESADRAQIKTDSIAIVADPVFAADDLRVSRSVGAQTNLTGNLSPNPIGQTTPGFERATRDAGFENFARLRFSREEAAAISALAPRRDLFEAMDFAASKKNVLSADFGKHRIIHLATHGLIDSQNPELSGIVLSLVDEKGDAQDGFLRLFEIYNLKLESDLVVLSACRTALGRDVRGEGLIGLTRGFMYAGAPRVVASLWSIDDRATAELMKRFYVRMLREKMSPANALRMAQIEMLKNARWQNPYYWAAFTLQGEWK